jgi:class 3 adenylate cyclase
LCAVDENYRIALVVNDDADAEFVNRYLAGSGIAVERFACGNKLVNGKQGQLNADMFIVDAAESNGSMGGLQLGRELKACPLTVSIPIVALGKSRDERLRSFEIGVDDYLSTETSQDEFLTRVRGLLRVGAIRRAANDSLLEAEVQRRRELGDTFRRYVSPVLVDQILSDSRLRDSALANKSTRVHATVLFADMRGFTRMSEQLAASDVVPLLNEYFRLLTQVVFQFEGTVFNMAGDCLMVGFGVPFAQRDATVRAFRAAKEMLVRFDDLISNWKTQYGIEAGLGIGINEGDVVVGNVGSSAYMNYTIIGDAVNVAARLSQRARAGELLFSQYVKKSLDDAGEDCGAVQMQPISLRGRHESLEIFCVPVPTRFELPYRLETLA